MRIQRLTFPSSISNRASHSHAFTMIELALSIAIVAFALVAILGVLPTGMRVQRDNREDTIINAEGAFFLEAIRSGSQGLNELTNFVEEIRVERIGGLVTNYVPLGLSGSLKLTNGAVVVGLLSIPKYETNRQTGRVETNKITARVRAITGGAAEKSGGVTNEFGFRYELTTEIIPFPNVPTNSFGTNLVAYNQSRNWTNQLHDVRLTLRWPVYQRGNNTWATGRGRKTFRTLMPGYLVYNSFGGYYFRPAIYTNLNLSTNAFL